MADIYLSNMGELWNGGSINITSVDIGEDGWIFLGGIDQHTDQGSHALVVMGYKDAELMWKKEFPESHYWGNINAITYKNGSIYATGGIGIEFDSVSLGGVTAPPGKPAPNAELQALYSEHWEALQTYPILLKLNAEDGALQMAKIIESNNVQVGDTMNSIQVDASGNIYVAGGGWNPGPDPTDRYNGADFYWRTLAYDSDGNFIWQFNGIGPVELGPDGAVYSTRSQNEVVKLDSNGQIAQILDAGYTFINLELGFYMKDWVWDAAGDLYVVATRDDQTINYGAVYSGNGRLSTSVVKISGVTGERLWVKEFDTTRLDNFSEPESIVIDPNNKLLIAGSTRSDMNDVTAYGKSDGYLVTMNPDTGEIEETIIVGTAANEGIGQVKFDAEGNLLIAGSFGAKYYSIEGTDYQNIFLISDEGFTLMGNGLDNEIHGGSGNDQINAGIGDDTLIGGDGNDVLNGGDGVDVADYGTMTVDLNIDLSKGVATGDGSDLLVYIENARGGVGDDILIAASSGSELDGGGGNDQLVGGSSADTLYAGDGDDTVVAGSGNDLIVGGDGAGDDTYNGGDGIDTVKYTSARAGVVINLTFKSGNAKSLSADTAGIGVDKLSKIENVIAGNYDDLITGDSSNNRLEGCDGDDVIDGGKGNDTLIGGAGADTLKGGAGNDTYYIDAEDNPILDAQGVDTVFSYITYTLGANLENLTLVGSDATNGAGNGLKNILIGNDAANILDGAIGVDQMLGGVGDDIYIVDNVKDLIVENVEEGFDSVRSSVSYVLGSNLERLTLMGAAHINATGNHLDNQLIGNAGKNKIAGGLGQDFLEGGSGADTFTFDTLASDLNYDQIFDFTSADGDKIALKKTGVFSNLQVKGRALKANDLLVVDHHDGSVSQHLIFDTVDHSLYYNADGSGSGAVILIATLDNINSLSHTDFLII